MVAWEQRKLGSVGKTQSGVGFPDSEQGGNEGIPFFKVSDMNNKGNENEMVTANNYVSEEQVKRKKWKPLETVPAVIFAKVGAAIMLNRKRIIRSPFLFDNNTMAYIFDDSWNVEFGKTLFETINLPKYAQIGALPSYNSSDIESIEVTVPDKIEQIKIGYLFKQLDKTIALQERELELLKLTKKGFLQQLFTDNQQKFPNIRFANFHDEWQQRKLGDTLLFLKSGLSRLFSNIDIGLPVVRANNINNGILNMKNDVKYWYQIDTKGAKNENYYIHKNDILINFINSEAKMGTAAVVREEPARETIYTTNILKAQVNKDYEHYFWFSLTQINKYKNDIKLITKPAVNQASFTTVDFKKLSYKFPNIDEQAKIGSFFKQLDETILIQEQKLEKLKRLKKAFLQKMFI